MVRTGAKAAGEDQHALDFRVLGPMQASLNGAPIRLGGIKPRAVLASLLINANRVVPAESIAVSAWNGDPPDSYLATLQVYVSTLRKVLGAPSHGGNAILETVAPGYRLQVPDGQTDLSRFRKYREHGQILMSSRKVTEAADSFRLALEQWSGSALSDLAGLRFAEEFANALEEERLSTLQWRIQADLECGRHQSLVGELTDLTSRHPLREPLWVQLMLALYRCGRQAEALDAGRRLRFLLGNELGIDPSPMVQDLERRILRQDVPAPPGGSPVPASVSATMVESDDRPSRALLRDGSGRTTAIPAVGLRLGRDVDNDMILDDAKISRHHAVIVDTGADFVISDLRSTNGTFVGNTRVADSRSLDDSDVIRLGNTELRFELSG